MAYATIGVKPSTKELLNRLKAEYHEASYDSLIKRMAKEHKGKLLKGIFGAAPELSEFKRNKNEYERNIK